MNMVLITFRSITPAQRAQRLLRQQGVDTGLMRTPRRMEQRSCGYCLRLRRTDLARAISALQGAGIPVEGVLDWQTGERVAL